MEFHKYQTTLDYERKYYNKKATSEDVWRLYGGGDPDDPDVHTEMAVQMTMEARWRINRRPFYNVWPIVQDALARVDLSKVTGSMLQIPLPQLELRFAKSSPVSSGNAHIGGVLVAEREVPPSVAANCCATTPILKGKADQITRALVVCVRYITPGVAADESEVSGSFSFPLLDDMSVDMLWKAVQVNNTGDPDMADKLKAMSICLRIFVSLCFLEEDSEIFKRIVLAKDAKKYEETGDPKYLEKAIRRGQYGWDVGKDLKVQPHVRRRHFAIRWMGQGEPKKPVLRPVRGCVVNKDKITDMPTGHDE